MTAFLSKEGSTTDAGWPATPPPGFGISEKRPKIQTKQHSVRSDQLRCLSHLPADNPAQTQEPAGTGYVYFVQAGPSDGPIKIGLALDPDSRLGDLQVANHEELRLLATVEGDYVLEHQLHRQLAQHHRRGEWFNDHEDVRQAIRELHATPDGHKRELHAAPGNGVRCDNCGAYLTTADGTASRVA